MQLIYDIQTWVILICELVPETVIESNKLLYVQLGLGQTRM